jgi:hypothetical protein
MSFETKTIKETMLFACHSGLRAGRIVGITSKNAIPLAFSHDIDCAEAGLSAAYEFFPTPRDFFRAILGPGAVIEGYRSNSGIWAYDVEYEVNPEGDVIYPDRNNDSRNEGWDHLQEGKLRRPAEIELSFLIGNCGACANQGWVLL